MENLFRYLKTWPEIIRVAVMIYVRFPLSLRNVEDLLHERGIDISYETNNLNLHRHLISQVNYKTKREAATIRWQQLPVI